MYNYIAKVTLRVAAIVPIIAYCVTMFDLYKRDLDTYRHWSMNERVFECVSKVADDQIRASENAFGNFDARKFNCIARNEPYWTNIKELIESRASPKYYFWPNAVNGLVNILVVAFIVIT
mgnify:CR=1 FL=1